MLLLTAALGLCDGGLYWAPSLGDCVTAKQCVNKSMVAYKLFMQCSRKFTPNVASGYKPDTNGVSVCPDGSYTVLGKNSIWCVNGTDDCKDCFVFRGMKVIAAGPQQCWYLAGQLAYDWEGKNECVNNCYGRGGFTSKPYCFNVTQCNALGMKAYTQGSDSICGKLEIADKSTFDQKILEAGIYTCTNSLFDAREGGARCIPTTTCKDYLNLYYLTCIKECTGYHGMNSSQKICV